MPLAKLTLAELEAATSLGLTGLFTLNGTRVTGHEAFCAESLLIVCVYFYESTGNCKTQCLALSRETSTAKINLDVIFFSHVKKSERLLYNKLQDGRGEVLRKISLVNGYFACSLGYVDTGDGALTTT